MKLDILLKGIEYHLQQVSVRNMMKIAGVFYLLKRIFAL